MRSTHVCGLRTAPTRSYRVFSLIWRSLVIFFGAIAFGLEVSIVNSVYDKRFPSYRPEMSALPAWGLSIIIMCNTVAIATVSFVMPCLYTVADLLALVSLIILGYTGFNYDNIHYLRNGRWRDYNRPSFLPMEITAAVIMVIVGLLQVVLVLVTPFTRARGAERTENYHYEREGLVEDETVAYFERNDIQMSPSKTSFDSFAKANLKKH